MRKNLLKISTIVLFGLFSFGSFAKDNLTINDILPYVQGSYEYSSSEGNEQDRNYYATSSLFCDTKTIYWISDGTAYNIPVENITEITKTDAEIKIILDWGEDEKDILNFYLENNVAISAIYTTGEVVGNYSKINISNALNGKYADAENLFVADIKDIEGVQKFCYKFIDDENVWIDTIAVNDFVILPEKNKYNFCMIGDAEDGGYDVELYFEPTFENDKVVSLSIYSGSEEPDFIIVKQSEPTTPTSIKSIETNINICSSNGAINVSGLTEAQSVEIYNALGRMIVCRVQTADALYEMPCGGVYFVKVGGKTQKVVLQ